jgi:Uma2 family endonuclease
VVCDKSKIDKNSIKGAPDIVIEILSRSTAPVDCVYKFQAYLRSGVHEYWIIDPEKQLVNVSVLDGDKYVTSTFSVNDIIESSVIDELKINCREIFEIE